MRTTIEQHINEGFDQPSTTDAKTTFGQNEHERRRITYVAQLLIAHPKSELLFVLQRSVGINLFLAFLKRFPELPRWASDRALFSRHSSLADLSSNSVNRCNNISMQLTKSLWFR